MKQSQFDRWVQQIHETQDEEISCSECFDLTSQYVDLEIAGVVAGDKLARVRQHLDQCRACYEEYEVLRDLARQEAEGHPPSLEDLRQSF